MAAKFVKSTFLLIVAALLVASAWITISIIGYGMTFDRDEFRGIKKGMTRAAVIEELAKSGVTELESQPDDAVIRGAVISDISKRSGSWINIKNVGYQEAFDRFSSWRYQVPHSYSTVDVRFVQDKLVSIKYRWRPFEG